MCDKGGDLDHREELASPGRRRALIGGASLAAAAPFLKLVHVAENTRVEPGPGSMNFRPGFRVLKKIGYSGFVEVESRTLSGPAAKVLPASVEYLHAEWRRA